MTLVSTGANVAWFLSNIPGAHQFQRALQQPRETQTRLLARLLHTHADTQYGRRWRFEKLRTAEAFRDGVPLTDYEDYAASMQQIAAGQPRVLTRDRVRLFEVTSGSTQAAKWIPFTGGLQRQIRQAVAAWAFDLVRQQPALLRGRSYWSISPALRPQGASDSRVPVGFEEDSAYLGGLGQRLVDASLAVPGNLARIGDVDHFRRVTLVALLQALDLRLMSVWHPSFLLSLVDQIERDWDTLVETVRTGIADDAAGVHLPGDPQRARSLRRLDRIDPTTLWPQLRLVSCWGDAHARLGKQELASRFPHCRVQSKGLIATEGFVSIPFADHFPLALTSHFFEFVDDQGRPHFSWELEEGASYSVVLTTAGGLYRYRLRDIVTVTGFLGRTPCLRFDGRESQVSDLRGEKLHEAFVGEVLRKLLPTEGPEAIRFAMLAPQQDKDTPGYVLFLESPAESQLGSHATFTPSTGDLASRLESALRSNPHYEYCAALGQLRPVRIQWTAPGTYDRYSRRLADLGQRLGDIKPSALSTRDDWEAFLSPPHAGAAPSAGPVLVARPHVASNAALREPESP